MNNLINVEIISAEGYLFQGEAYQVVVPTVSGMMGVLAGHEQVVSELQEGKIEIIDANNKIEKVVEVKSGMAEIHAGGLRILIDS